jgi:integrase
MASISKRMVGGKPRYDVNYREPDGTRRRKTFPTKAAADRYSASVETDKSRGVYLDPDAGRVTFKRYAQSWLEAQTFEQTTRESTELRLRLHIYPVLGSKTLAQLRPSTIQAWLRGLEGTVKSAKYRGLILSNASSILSAAVDDELIAKNPCRAGSVHRPRVEPRKVIPWTGEQVQAVTEALPERFRIAAALAAGLGLRQGEVFGLSPDDVDFLRGAVDVRRQVRLYRGNQQAFWLPKGNKTRTVPLPGSVRDMLAAHLAQYPARSVRLPWRTVDGEHVSSPLVLSTRETTALNRNYINTHVWKVALRKAGVEPSRENGMHALRHYYASVLLDAGESIKAVSEYLGHSDAGFTLRCYCHLMPSSTERTKSAVDAAFACYMGATSSPENAVSQA